METKNHALSEVKTCFIAGSHSTKIPFVTLTITDNFCKNNKYKYNFLSFKDGNVWPEWLFGINSWGSNSTGRKHMEALTSSASHQLDCMRKGIQFDNSRVPQPIV